MSLSTLFNSEFRLAPYVISSGLLLIPWKVITSSDPGINSYEGVGLSWKVHLVPFQEKELKIIAFETKPVSQDHAQADLVSSSDLKKEKFLDFDFICTERNPLFSVNNTAVSLLHKNHQMLDQLKSECVPKSSEGDDSTNSSSTPLLVTGRALAGSVASLFTLSLLDTVGSGKNRPLCITFGSPLIGDKKLQEAISLSSTWNSCFLHVVSHKDPLPRLFITNHSSQDAASSSQTSQTSAYMPFGAFLMCSDVGSTCSVDPDFILQLLVAMGSIHVQNQEFQSADYGNIVENVYRKAIYNDFTTRAEDMNHPDSLLAMISFQLGALGLTPHMQQQNVGINILEMKEKLEEKFTTRRTPFNPFKTLNLRKKDMVQLEWYKRATRNEGIGYYDSYKNMKSGWDKDVNGCQQSLTDYWKNTVEEAEMKPQKEGAAFRTTWLKAGTNYRRMVEPLVIAQYYGQGGKDYVTKKRSKHFEKLEEWLRKGKPPATSNLNSTSKHNVESILTLDSCFWAHVEEALLSCEELKDVTKKEEAKQKLIEFQNNVYDLLKKSSVSPEIFLPKSSYMRWWNEYRAIKGASYNSKLASFMSNERNYKEYAKGAYNFP